MVHNKSKICIACFLSLWVAVGQSRAQDVVAVAIEYDTVVFAQVRMADIVKFIEADTDEIAKRLSGYYEEVSPGLSLPVCEKSSFYANRDHLAPNRMPWNNRIELYQFNSAAACKQFLAAITATYKDMFSGDIMDGEVESRIVSDETITSITCRSDGEETVCGYWLADDERSVVSAEITALERVLRNNSGLSRMPSFIEERHKEDLQAQVLVDMQGAEGRPEFVAEVLNRYTAVQADEILQSVDRIELGLQLGATPTIKLELKLKYGVVAETFLTDLKQLVKTEAEAIANVKLYDASFEDHQRELSEMIGQFATIPSGDIHVDGKLITFEIENHDLAQAFAKLATLEYWNDGLVQQLRSRRAIQ